MRGILYMGNVSFWLIFAASDQVARGKTSIVQRFPKLSILACLLLTVGFAFLYFAIALRVAAREKVYVVPFVGAALFFWHDLTFVLMYDKWFHGYDHWWVKMWWFALVGTVALELVMIYHVYKYGREEL